MNKFGNVAIALVISSFLAFNFYLLFNDKSVIGKSVYVSDYERMSAGSFTEEMPKEALVSPANIHTVYVGSENDIESWLVTEGDHVLVGDELALLNTERSDGERELLETESNALSQQKRELEQMITDLSAAQSNATTNNSSNVDRKENVTEVDGETTITLDLGIGFTVDVTQEGSYAQAIAAAEQQLTEVIQQLTVVDAMLTQSSSRPAIISPVEGVVSNVTRNGSHLAVDLYSTERIVVTYAKDDEWSLIEEGDRVLLQGTNLEGVVEGIVLSVSTVPATPNKTVETYKKMDSEKATNPLAYYEVQISTANEFDTIPFGHNVNAIVILNETNDAVSVNKNWLRLFEEETANGMIIDSVGKAQKVTVKTPFQIQSRAIVTEGLSDGQIAILPPEISDEVDGSKVFLPLPKNIPALKEFKALNWKKYVEYMILR